MIQAEKGKQGELLCANILASGGWLCFFPENKFASQADIKAVHCVSDEVKRIEVKTQTTYAFKEMLSYPWTPAQIKKIDKVDEIWFVCTSDNNIRSNIKQKLAKWEGNVYKVTSQEMKDYIKRNEKNSSIYKFDEKTGLLWFNYPINRMELVGKVDTTSLRNDGTTAYTSYDSKKGQMKL